MVIKYVVPPILSLVILVIALLTFIRRRKESKISALAQISPGNACRRVSYAELAWATGSFSETNLLGEGSFGSVFRGTLSHGLDIALKVFNLELEGAGKSFDTETEILSTIRHRNLARLIGYCTEQEFKALVLALMPNGSLDKCLYSENYCMSGFTAKTRNSNRCCISPGISASWSHIPCCSLRYKAKQCVARWMLAWLISVFPSSLAKGRPWFKLKPCRLSDLMLHVITMIRVRTGRKSVDKRRCIQLWHNAAGDVHEQEANRWHV